MGTLKTLNYCQIFIIFHSLEVVDRVSETQLQVGENKHGERRFVQFEIIKNVSLALSDSFEYLYVMGLRPLKIVLLLQRGGRH